MPKKIELLPVLLDGKPFMVDPSGQFAINQDGKAVMLEDPILTNSRFK